MATRAFISLMGVMAVALAPSERVSVDQWADKYRVVPASHSSSGGEWDNEESPYLVEPMRCLSDPRYRTVTLQKGSQVGGTEIAFNAAMCWADIDPGPMMMVYPSTKLAEKVNRERFEPSIKATPRAMMRLRGKQHDITGLHVTFDRCSLSLVGSNSETNLSSAPIRYLIIDEMDQEEYCSKATALAKQRLKGFPKRKCFQISTPSYVGVGINAEFVKGDQRRYEVPCPHCSRFQQLVWRQVRWVGPNGPNDVRAESSVVDREAWYECEHCRGKIENRHKREMLRRGRWLKEGERHDEHGKVIGAALKPDTDHASFQISSLYSPKLNFGYIASVYIDNGGEATRQWVNGELGEPWAVIGGTIEAEECEHLCVPVVRGGYSLRSPIARRADGGLVSAGRLPPWVMCLIGSIDVQDDRAYVEIRGFGAHAQQSGLIFCTVVPVPVNNPNSLANLNAWISARWLHDDGVTMDVAAWGIDSGDGGRTLEIYRWSMNWPNLFVTKGFPSMRWAKPFELTPHSIDDAAKSAIKRGAAGPEVLSGQRYVKLLKINTHIYKELVMACLRRPVQVEAAGTLSQAEANAARQRVTGGRVMLFPEIDNGGVVKGYMRQLTSEHLGPIRKVDGNVRMGWALKPGRKDNHHLDTCVMALAIADSQNAADMLSPAAFKVQRERVKVREMAALAGKRTSGERRAMSDEVGEEGGRSVSRFVGGGGWQL